MTRRLLNALLVLALLYGGVCALAWLFQSRLVYFPAGAPSADPGAAGLAFRDVELETADGVRLHAWFVPAAAATEPRGAVLFCHGNAGNVGHRLPSLAAFHALGLAVLILDYRGYGRSAGRPSEAGTYLDAEAAHAWLVGPGGFAPEEVVAYGESLGAGVAVELARRVRLAGLVLESPFTSVPDVGARAYPWLPVRLLARIRYANASKIGALDVPLLVIHSPADEIVPFSHGRALFERAPEPKAFLETEAGHNDGGFLRRPEWRERVGEFARDALRSASATTSGAER